MRRKRVDSLDNPLVKEVVRLRERRHRERSRRFVIEGVRETERAMDAGVELEQVLVAAEPASPRARDLSDRAEGLGVRVTELGAAAFRKCSQRENPDGLMALGVTWESRLDRLSPGPDSLLLVIDGLEKPGNLGALLRTADSANVTAVLVTGDGTDPFNPNVIRASMGSVFSRPLISVDVAELKAFLKVEGVRSIATSPSAETVYWDADMTGPLAILLGAEHSGLAAEWLEEADQRVYIPMAGSADSLNVATSGALILYEVLRQRQGRPGQEGA